MRGKADCQRGKELPFGITPAHAGKSFLIDEIQIEFKDHPRACGEKDGDLVVVDGEQGITPAHAGKSDTCPIRSGDSRDHPRACGEKQGIAGCSVDLRGSPPRMRGKGVARPLQTLQKRITPAHAGKRIFRHITAYLNWDHPRACGEKQFLLWCSFLVTGSPPRMRGKATIASKIIITTRITPAHAGKRQGH